MSSHDTDTGTPRPIQDQMLRPLHGVCRPALPMSLSTLLASTSDKIACIAEFTLVQLWWAHTFAINSEGGKLDI